MQFKSNKIFHCPNHTSRTSTFRKKALLLEAAQQKTLIKNVILENFLVFNQEIKREENDIQ